MEETCVRSRAPEGTVTLMAAPGSREPARDLYQLLGVARDASRQEIALAWRRRAREEHPDARQGDAGAPARFRALAEGGGGPGRPGRARRLRPGPGPWPPPPGPGPGHGPAPARRARPRRARPRRRR